MSKKNTTPAEEPSSLPTPSLEDQLKRLEEISRLLDTGDQPLDKQLALYEEGIALAEACRQYLQKAELRVAQLGE